MARRMRLYDFTAPPSLGFTPSSTCDPSSPLMREMLVSMATSLVVLPSTVTMMSPGLRPASLAGESSNTVVMTRPSSLFSRAAPMPKYLPLCVSLNFCRSWGER